MLLNVFFFFSLGVCGWIVSLCSRCGAFCLICDARSCKCWCIGSTLVSSCSCCVLVSCVHPVAILRAVFCTICIDPGMSLNCDPTRVCRKSAHRPWVCR